MTYYQTTCGGSSMMRAAGADGLTWADAPDQACTISNLPPLKLFLDASTLSPGSQVVSVQHSSSR